MLEANGPNLSAFRLQQRKLLMYRSWGMVPSEDVICYYESVQNVIGGTKNTRAFFACSWFPVWAKHRVRRAEHVW
jgi:hypothetical protein